MRFHLARHFGFCYGVENAIEIIYRVIHDNPGKNVFLLSEMIHNPNVNTDLLAQGVQFVQDTKGNQLIAWEDLTTEDIIVVPAFGTTVEIYDKIKTIGLETHQYDTTCPFVEKVWKRADKLGKEDCTIVIHGKRGHEETRATFSHAKEGSPVIVVQNLSEANVLSNFLLGKLSLDKFNEFFKGFTSKNFDAEKGLHRIGVINQTTMLATETQEIADFLKQSMLSKYGEQELKSHFADTRDTLCYATSDNQGAVYGMLDQKADLAFVVGGYNSSNTSHLAELCEDKLPTFFISDASKLMSGVEVEHFDFHKKEILTTSNFIPQKDVVDILITSGASCPDAIVEEVIEKAASFFENVNSLEAVLSSLEG